MDPWTYINISPTGDKIIYILIEFVGFTIANYRDNVRLTLKNPNSPTYLPHASRGYQQIWKKKLF